MPRASASIFQNVFKIVSVLKSIQNRVEHEVPKAFFLGKIFGMGLVGFTHFWHPSF